MAARYVHRTLTEDGSEGHLAVDKASLALEAVIGLAERVRKLEAA